MKSGEQSSLRVITVLISFLSPLLVGAGVLTPGRFTQHEYERFDNYSMIYDAARAACQFRGAHLDLPVLSSEEIHYRSPDILSVLRDVWYWAPMSREVGDVWRWWNGSQVDVNDDDKKALRTNDVITTTSCAAWNLSVGYVPESCQQSHSFLCLTNTTIKCRLRTYGYTYEYHGIMWNNTGYPVYDTTLSQITALFQQQSQQQNQTPAALYQLNGVGSWKCSRLCNDLHWNVSLHLGCWFAQSQWTEEGRWQDRLCLLLLAPAFPTASLLPVLAVNNTRVWFRTCFRQYSASNSLSCPLQCGCTDPRAPSTMAEAVAEEKRIKSRLTLPTANLSATVRRKTSAVDARPSARAVGVVGVVIISSLLVLVVILDLTSLRRDLRKLMTNIKALPAQSWRRE